MKPKPKTTLAATAFATLAIFCLATPASGNPQAEEVAAKGCGGGLSARINVWEFQEGNQSIIGWGPEATVGYTVDLQRGANAVIGAEGKGYDAFGNETWYGMGTTSVGHLERVVPWGEVAALPAVKVLNSGPALAPPVYWNAC